MRLFIPNLKGGLGNQLFQITQCMRLAKRHGGAFAIDPSRPFNAGQGDHPKEYLRTFYRTLRLTSSRGLPIWNEGDPEVFADECSYVVDGYFQKLIEEDLRDKVLDTFRWYDVVSRRKVIGVHVRGGDYRKLREVYPEITADQYGDSLSKVMDVLGGNRFQCEVHTDDQEYADQLFPGKSMIGDFLKLGECEAMVLSNSTWAWWAAYLGEVPLIVYPQKWINQEHQFNLLSGLVSVR